MLLKDSLYLPREDIDSYVLYGVFLGALLCISLFLPCIFSKATVHYLQANPNTDEEDQEENKVGYQLNNPLFSEFQERYLVVFLIMMMADWMQGPYMYDLYQSYGYGINDIGLLFLTGFGSSMLFGPIVGSASDQFGRRLVCLLFVLVYCAACVLIHFPDFYLLLLGRFLSGIATAILFSSFESWMIKEHFGMNFNDVQLRNTFSKATTGNGIVAIGAGIVSALLREYFGRTAPFKGSFCLLVIGGIFLIFSWSENYGDSSKSMFSTIKDSCRILSTDRQVLLLGLIQSCFESMLIAMYLSSYKTQVRCMCLYSCGPLPWNLQQIQK